MARRRKNRTHLKGAGSTAQEAEDGVPKSFIIKHGQVGSSLTQLVRDLRKVMEPNTASRLKERNRNKLKDYLTLAPALKVSHLIALTLTDVAPSLRIVRLPAGPTLSFRVERYSLMKDVMKSSRSARSMGMEYLTAPLLVLASFPPPSPTTPPHLPLLMKSFQSLFPPLSPKAMSLSGARRIVLIAYNADRGSVDFRHYVITVKPYGVSKRVRRVLEGASKKSSSTSTTGFLDLGNEKDVADFLLRRSKTGHDGDGGYESAASSTSSVAGDDGDAVDLADDYVGRNNRKGQKKAVKLDEIGPRMELRLIKITEGVPGKEGGVMYHEFGEFSAHLLFYRCILTQFISVKKTKQESAALKASHAAKEKLRKQRREEQERNVQRKKEAKNSLAPGEDSENGETGPESGLEDDGGDSGWDEDEEISDGDESGGDESDDSEDDASEERPPVKKVRIHGKR
ncbi:Brix-domain-containing protein [Leucogyrophana mollusca]|uniref:Brix-domain-containing protein n=1 Tax=Leucogyrophana mollusca TaxID=85980 RepID=A0ACB8BM03_9AGAM|nr:Brix-domain-containing protein [Leucogyrophana mollusca]